MSIKRIFDPLSHGSAHWLWWFVLALMLTLFTTAQLCAYEQAIAEAAFQHRANQELDEFADRMRLSLARLDELGAYFDATPEVSRALFQHLARPLLDQHSPIDSLQWVPAIAGEDRAALILAARAEYFSIATRSPSKGNESMSGFDPGSNPVLLTALQKANATRAMIATGQIRLGQGGDDRDGIFVLRPVFSVLSAASSTQRRGFVVAVLRPDRILQQMNQSISDLRLFALDNQASGDHRWLYPKKAPAKSLDQALAATQVSETIKVADREWTVVAVPAGNAVKPQRVASLAVLVLGLMFSVLLALFLRQHARRRKSIEQKRSAQTNALEQERNFNRAILDSVDGVIMVIDRKAEIVRFNHQAELLTGYTEDEVLGRPYFWVRFALPEQRDQIRAEFDLFCDGTIFSRHTHYWRCADGETRLLDWRNTLIFDAQGKPEYLVMVGVDVTERRRGLQVIQECEARNHSIIDASPVPQALNNTEQEITYLNAAFTRLFGYTHEDIPTLQHWWQAAYPDPEYRDWVAHQWQANLEKSQREDSDFEPIEVRIRCKDGVVRTAMAFAAEMIASTDKAQKHDEHLVTLFDITERKQIERALKERENRFRQMFEQNKAIMLLIDPLSGHIIDANAAACAFYGWSHDELCQMSIRQIIHLDESALAAERAMAQAEKRVFCVLPHQLADGRIRTVEMLTSSIDVDARKLNISIIFDVSERKATEERIQQLVHEQDVILDNALTGIVRLQGDRILWANHTFEKMLQREPGELNGRSMRAYFSDEATFSKIFASASALFEQDQVFRGEISLLRRDGSMIWCEVSGRALDAQTGESLWTILDITDRKQAEDVIRQLAFFDPLTHLPNRRLLSERLKQSLSFSQRHGEYGALLALDLDRFKMLNDTHGHDMGDLLLKAVAERLQWAVRQEDTVARLGGDEFIVLLTGLGTEEAVASARAVRVAEKIREVLSQPYVLGEQKQNYRNSPSIGITLFLGQSLNSDTLFKQADLALYQSKNAGRNLVRLFSPKMQLEIDGRLAMEVSLREGIERNELVLFYQPQVDQIGQLVGVEALLRWQHPERGLVPPTTFISLAEETGLILPIGQWVLDTACAQLRRWAENPATDDLIVSINVSARQFRQPNFVASVRASLERHRADPTRLKLELTESAIIENMDMTVPQMEALTEIGVKFALDDFGTGYSSLAYLKRLPLSDVKIDQSFVRDITTDVNDAAIVRAILAMSKTLGLNVVAEGVETEAQRVFLLAHDCGFYQGYLFGRPVPVDEIGPLLDEGAILL